MRPWILLPLATLAVACTTVQGPGGLPSAPEALEAIAPEPDIPDMEAPDPPRPGSPAFEAMAEAAAPLALPAFAIQPPGPKTLDELRVHFLPVGAGSCYLVECPGTDARAILYDCGRTEASPNSMTKNEVRDYVGEILDRYDQVAVVVSHHHSDHYNLVGIAADGITAESVWLGGTTWKPAGSWSGSGIRSWLENQESSGVPIHWEFSPGHSSSSVVDLQCGDSTDLLTVNNKAPANSSDGTRKNTASLILRIDYGSQSLILAGDATKIAEKAALVLNNGREVTVLAAAHHGASSDDSSHAQWVKKTSPEFVVYSAGDEYGHPRCVVIERFASQASTASGHLIRCGTTVNKKTVYAKPTEIVSAQYLTETAGPLWITLDGTSTTIDCGLTDGCH